MIKNSPITYEVKKNHTHRPVGVYEKSRFLVAEDFQTTPLRKYDAKSHVHTFNTPVRKMDPKPHHHGKIRDKKKRTDLITKGTENDNLHMPYKKSRTNSDVKGRQNHNVGSSIYDERVLSSADFTPRKFMNEEMRMTSTPILANLSHHKSSQSRLTPVSRECHKPCIALDSTNSQHQSYTSFHSQGFSYFSPGSEGFLYRSPYRSRSEVSGQNIQHSSTSSVGAWKNIFIDNDEGREPWGKCSGSAEKEGFDLFLNEDKILDNMPLKHIKMETRKEDTCLGYMNTFVDISLYNLQDGKELNVMNSSGKSEVEGHFDEVSDRLGVTSSNYKRELEGHFNKVSDRLCVINSNHKVEGQFDIVSQGQCNEDLQEIQPLSFKPKLMKGFGEDKMPHLNSSSSSAYSNGKSDGHASHEVSGKDRGDFQCEIRHRDASFNATHNSSGIIVHNFATSQSPQWKHNDRSLNREEIERHADVDCLKTPRTAEKIPFHPRTIKLYTPACDENGSYYYHAANKLDVESDNTVSQSVAADFRYMYHFSYSAQHTYPVTKLDLITEFAFLPNCARFP